MIIYMATVKVGSFRCITVKFDMDQAKATLYRYKIKDHFINMKLFTKTNQKMITCSVNYTRLFIQHKTA